MKRRLSGGWGKEKEDKSAKLFQNLRPSRFGGRQEPFCNRFSASGSAKTKWRTTLKPRPLPKIVFLDVREKALESQHLSNSCGRCSSVVRLLGSIQAPYICLCRASWEILWLSVCVIGCACVCVCVCVCEDGVCVWCCDCVCVCMCVCVCISVCVCMCVCVCMYDMLYPHGIIV